jgi:hypothetical protein
MQQRDEGGSEVFYGNSQLQRSLEKCAKISIKRGTVQRKEHVENTAQNEIKELVMKKAHRYLGIEENYNIEHKKEKARLKKEYTRRLIMNTELNAKNKKDATGSLAVPVLRYSFGIINWHREEIYKLDRKMENLIYGQHHLRADIDHLYIPRKGGGQGLTQINAAYMIETTKLAEYIYGSEDPLL